MPGGITFSEGQSYIAFGVIKFIGYSLAALTFNYQYKDKHSNFLLVGLVRNLIGVVIGFTLGFVAFNGVGFAFVLFLLGLVPFRIFEWWAILKLFYDTEDSSKMWNSIAQGLGWSFALDIPAIFGFLVTGGLWIC